MDPVNEKFETVGFESLYFMNNLGSFILIIIGKILLMIIWYSTLNPFTSYSEWIKKRANWLRNKISLNSWITVIF